jgi:hypothetical protein
MCAVVDNEYFFNDYFFLDERWWQLRHYRATQSSPLRPDDAALGRWLLCATVHDRCIHKVVAPHVGMLRSPQPIFSSDGYDPTASNRRAKSVRQLFNKTDPCRLSSISNAARHGPVDYGQATMLLTTVFFLWSL